MTNYITDIEKSLSLELVITGLFVIKKNPSEVIYFFIFSKILFKTGCRVIKYVLKVTDCSILSEVYLKSSSISHRTTCYTSTNVLITNGP